MTTYRSDIPELIKSRLTIREVCERYGVSFNSHNKALCPFHDDHDPSANIKESDQSFHCSVCGIHGDIFTFTMKMFNIDFPQAIIRLNNDFCLGLTAKKPNRDDIIRLQQERKKRAELKRLEAAETLKFEFQYVRYDKLRDYILNDLKHSEPITTPLQAKRRANQISTLEFINYFFLSHTWR